MQQSQALDILKLGHNVFLTGEAGSGKTHVLRQYIHYLKEKRIQVGVTASTGIAATHLQGMTIHSWAGIGIHDNLNKQQLNQLSTKKPLAKRFRDTQVLIIDEVSMLHGARLDLVDVVARLFKDPDKPFGGLQVILSGDLFQLPPVTRDGEVDWVFQSSSWQNMNLHLCYLTEQHRQDDVSLLRILNAIRRNTVTEDHHMQLRERYARRSIEGLTKLYTHNVNVDSINNKKLSELDTEARTYQMTSRGSKPLVASLQKSCLAPAELTLKIGARVMFVVNNLDKGFVNGTLGRVVAFDIDDLPIILTNDGRKITADHFSWKIMDGEQLRASITQMPLRLAWAITVHKSQGMSLDAAEIDLSRAFEPGMGYVALSRVRTLNGLYLRGANEQSLRVSPVIQEFDELLQKKSTELEAELMSLDRQEIMQEQQEFVRARAASVANETQAYDAALFEALRAWRKRLAVKQQVPAYVIMSDKALQGIARDKPQLERTLLYVSGVGKKSVEKYGAEILAVVAKHS